MQFLYKNLIIGDKCLMEHFSWLTLARCIFIGLLGSNKKGQKYPILTPSENRECNSLDFWLENYGEHLKHKMFLPQKR